MNDANDLLEDEGMGVNAKASVRNVADETKIIIIIIVTKVVAFVSAIGRGMVLHFRGMLCCFTYLLL